MVLKTIDECFTSIQNGANIKQNDGKSGYPITRIETISNDRFNRDRMGYADIYDANEYSSYILEEGDLLMSHINSPQYLGRTVLYKKDGDEIIIHGMNLLRLKAKTDIIFPNYIRYYFYSHSFRDKIAKITKKSVNQASFSVTDLKKIKINIIPKLEQIEVSRKLDQINKIIEEDKQLLNKCDELIKARFVEMFEGKGFEEKRIDEVCSLKSGTTFPHEVEKENGDILYCKVSDMNLIGNEKYMEKSKAYVSNEVGLKTCMPPETVIFPKRGGAIGTNKKRITLYQTCVDLNTMGVIHGTELNVQYLYYYFIKLDLGTLCDGSAVPQLNNKNIGPLKIAMPPIELQNQFADFVKQVDKSKFKDIV